MTIYTLGYTGWKLDEVAAVLERLNAILADVRMVPRSRNPIWNSAALAKRFADRYVWLKQFGNRQRRLGPGELFVEQVVTLFRFVITSRIGHGRFFAQRCPAARSLPGKTPHRTGRADRGLAPVGARLDNLDIPAPLATNGGTSFSPCATPPDWCRIPSIPNPNPSAC